MTNQFILRHCRRGFLCDLDQAAAFEKPKRVLHCGLGQTREFSKLLQTESNTALLGTKELCPKDDVYEKSRRAAVMPGEIRQQDVENVIVDRSMVHITIVIAIIGDCAGKKIEA